MFKIEHLVFFVVSRTHADYFKPAYLYDKLNVETVAHLARPTVMQFHQRVMHVESQSCLFDAQLDLVCVDQSLKPKPMPMKD